MRVLRWLAGAVLWILATVLGLVSILLCVTLILLPLGLPLLRLTRRLFKTATRLMLPRGVTHPVEEISKGAKKRGRRASSSAQDSAAGVTKKVRKVGRRARKQLT
jgi:hypothetical protein